MLKRPPIPQLAAVILAYFALWFLVPRATFLPAILRTIAHAMPHVNRFSGVLLYICGLLLLSLPTIAFMAIQVAIVYLYAKVKLNGWQAASALLGFIACSAALLLIAAGLLAHRPPDVGAFTVLRLFISLFTMLAAGSIGYMVSLRIKDKNLLLPVVMFAACIDMWTVSQGPVSTIIRRAPGVVAAVSAPIPQAGTGSFVPLTMIGPGDFLFMTLVFAAVFRLGMNARRNYWFVFVAMTLGMLAVMFGVVERFTGLEGLPALTVLAVAVVAANWREFKLSRQEAISIAIVGAILAASVPLVWSLLKPAETKKLPDKPKPPVTVPDRARR